MSCLSVRHDNVAEKRNLYKVIISSECYTGIRLKYWETITNEGLTQGEVRPTMKRIELIHYVSS